MLEVFTCEAGARAAIALATVLDTDVDLLVTMVVDTALKAAGQQHPGAHRLVAEAINGGSPFLPAWRSAPLPSPLNAIMLATS